MNCLLTLTSEEITAIIAGICTGIVSIIGAIGAIINNKRRGNCDNPKCCITGRALKPKKKKEDKAG